MVAAERRDAFPSHIALDNRGFGFAQVDHDQAVEHVGKFPVHIEADKPPAHFRVLFQQNRQAFTVDLDVGDRLGKFFHVTERVAGGPAVPAAQSPRTKRPARGD